MHAKKRDGFPPLSSIQAPSRLPALGSDHPVDPRAFSFDFFLLGGERNGGPSFILEGEQRPPLCMGGRSQRHGRGNVVVCASNGYIARDKREEGEGNVT